MIDDEALLVLPLMHHLVQQRVQRFFPPVAPNVAATQNYFRLASLASRAVVTQPALHAARDPDRDLAQRPIESILVVESV